MKYCEYCGQELTDTAKFCTSCGAPAPEAPQTTAQTVYTAQTTASEEYSILLVSLGNCTKKNAEEMISDTFGYTVSQARQLLSVLPAEAARSLTEQQAQYAAQAMTEYGMEVSIWNGSGYVAMEGSATESVFDSDGSFIAKAAAVLGMLGASNRISSFGRWGRSTPPGSGLLDFLFRPKYRRPQPPKHQRRLFGREDRPEPIPGRMDEPGRRSQRPREMEPLRNQREPVRPSATQPRRSGGPEMGSMGRSTRRSEGPGMGSGSMGGPGGRSGGSMGGPGGRSGGSMGGPGGRSGGGMGGPGGRSGGGMGGPGGRSGMGPGGPGMR